MRGENLVRLRVDPSKIRVGVRALSGPEPWQVSVTEIATGRYVVWKATDLEWAIDLALRSAEEARLPGIDRDLQWAYPHPQKRHKPGCGISRRGCMPDCGNFDPRFDA